MSDKKLRLRFKKTGRAVYISHLDLMRTMQRAFSRAEYELEYSKGFNPHPQISISLPLSVGVSSLCELMDFKLKNDEDLSLMPQRLTAQMPEGIEVYDAYEAERKASQLKWLEIEGVFEYDERNAQEILPELKDFFAQEDIVITKKTKRGMGQMDIKPAFKDLSLENSGNDVLLHVFVSAQEPTLNPELLADALRQKKPELAPDFAKFTRIQGYDAEMNIFR